MASRIILIDPKVIPQELTEIVDVVEDTVGVTLSDIVNIYFHNHGLVTTDAKILSQQLTAEITMGLDFTPLIDLEAFIKELETIFTELDYHLSPVIKLKPRNKKWLLSRINLNFIEVEEFDHVYR